MEQGPGGSEHNKKPFAYDPKGIDILFVTHAHIDHIGLIPKLVKGGFRGQVISTPETREISELLLLDSAKIQEGGERIYGLHDVSESLKFWKTIPYHQKKDFEGFSVELFDAGHVLGSSMVKLSTPKGQMLFTGDIGNSPSPLLESVEEVAGIDYLLMESVYGDRNHERREERVARFEKIVEESIARGGALLIPAFSLERTQEILMLLDHMFEEKKMKSAPVYLDSPLALRITPIFEKSLGLDRFNFTQLTKIASIYESQDIWGTDGAKIIIAGSGMSTAGRILGHEERYLPDPNSTILLMGYQAVGTLGRQIAEGVTDIVIDENRLKIRAKVENISGFSGHADSDALVSFIEKSASTLKKVLVAMGEPRSQIFLAQRLRDELNLDAVATEEGKSYELDF